MKKKIFAFAFCMITVMYMFTGCSLFEEDQERKLNQVVASVGNVEVTLDEFLRNYSNNAQSLIKEGYTAEQAVEYCLNSVLMREVIADIGKDMVKDKKVSISDVDKSLLINDLITYFGSFMDAYAKDVVKDLGYESAKSDKEDKNEGYTAETKFESNYFYGVKEVTINGRKTYKLSFEVLDKNKSEANTDYVKIYNDYVSGKNIDDTLYNILDKSYIAEFGEDMKDKIYEKIAINYKNNYKFYNKKSEKEIVMAEIKKIFNEYILQLYINKVSEYYGKIAESELTSLKLADNYKEKFNASKNLYKDNVDAYVKNMLDNASSVYYNTDLNAFGYVSHVLLQFSDEQKKDLEQKKKILSPKEYELYENKVAQQIKVKEYSENGSVIRENVSANEVLSEIQDSLLGIEDINERAKIFNKYIYKYNMDPGIKNAQRDYVVGREIKESGDADSRTKMVESFTDASRTLIEAYKYKLANPTTIDLVNDLKSHAKTEETIKDIKDGAYITYKEDYNKYLDEATFIGEKGALSGLVKSEHGYHIIMFTGMPENVDVDDEAIMNKGKLEIFAQIKELNPLSTITMEDLDNIFSNQDYKAMALKTFTINAHSNKTYLDETLEVVAKNMSINYTGALFNEYMTKYENTKFKYTINKKPYEYLYKA